VSTFGRWSGFPFEFSGDDPPDEQEHTALKLALSPDRKGFNTDDDLIDIECEAHAAALRIIWDVNTRTANQAIPARMLEEVVRWEEILKLRPSPEDSDNDRRNAIEAKLRGLTGNAIADIERVARAIFKQYFVAVNVVDPLEVYAWMPGVDPGPPGFEWSSNRMTIGISVRRGTMDDDVFRRRVSTLDDAIAAMLPVWMTYTVGAAPTDESGSSGFICDVSICDETLL
jgi:hypothetical protein